VRPVVRLPPALASLVPHLARALGHRPAYLVGGALRDALLGRPIKDLDLAVAAPVQEAGPEVARQLGGHYFPLGHQGMGRVLLPFQGETLQVDLHPLQGPIEEDLASRDYTIDAMALPLQEWRGTDGAIIDPLGGLDDLRQGLVRLTSPHALIQDPIRLLRGVRLACELGFRLEEETARLISAHRHRLPLAAPERQRDELVRIMATERAGEGLALMDQLGLLGVLLPELDPTRSFPQPPEHHWDVFGHLLATVSYLDVLLAPEPLALHRLWEDLWVTLGSLEDEVRRYLSEETAPGHPRKALVKMAGLLHDVAKPSTRTVDAQGRVRFFGHDKAGATVAAAIMARLRFSKRQGELVATMVRAHLRPMHMSHRGLPTSRAIFRFFRDCGEAAYGILLLSLADHLATVGPRLRQEEWLSHVQLVHYVLTESTRPRGMAGHVRLVSGHDIMEALGIPPGPMVGRLLRALEEAQAIGQVSTRQEALELARRLLSRWTERKAEVR
jgi:poly(A) polymerase